MQSTYKDQVISYLYTFIPQKTTIVVGVSGGPDSMFLATCLQEYYEIRGRDRKHIAIAHYNHGQRKESIKELSFLKKHFKYNTFYRNTEVPNKGLSETKLREHRHEFFVDVIAQSKCDNLFLGHNLTDRIETSIMNMVRGSSRDGILGIKPTQKNVNYTIYRPLLDITKDTITASCNELSIPYFVDATNTKLITPRNIIRNNITPQIQKLHVGGEKNRTKSRRVLYNLISGDPIEKKARNSHVPHIFWGAKHRFSAKVGNIDDNMIMGLFKSSYYATAKTLTTIKDFIDGSQGHLSIGGWYIFKVGDTIHCIDGKKDFWKEKHTYKQTISQHGNIDINGYTYAIQRQRKGYIFRYPQNGDTYKSKRLLKVLLNLKIPVFMRNVTALVVTKGSIISILQSDVTPSNLY